MIKASNNHKTQNILIDSSKGQGYSKLSYIENENFEDYCVKNGIKCCRTNTP